MEEDERETEYRGIASELGQGGRQVKEEAERETENRGIGRGDRVVL